MCINNNKQGTNKNIHLYIIISFNIMNTVGKLRSIELNN